ncbi:MAG: ABC transporter permease [Opitutaceae bacterium]|nr:ABC transporter permease [Opitutaceae bacterium]
MILPVFKREFLGYFRSPIGYVFLCFFLVLSVLIAFFFYGFFKNNLATLDSLFAPLPWLLLVMAPAAAMSLWAEERRSGTLELLFTLPMTPAQCVVAKFLAGWAFLSCAIILTFPLALTAAYLGEPDWGIIFSGYVGAILLAGAYLAVCSLTSALTKSQVVSFIIGFFACFLFAFLGTSIFNQFLGGFLGLPVGVVDAIANFSPFTHYAAFPQGIIDSRDVIFFGSVTVAALAANVVVLER